MKQAKLFKSCTLALLFASAAGVSLTGCTEKNLYDPDSGKQELPAPGTLPDFSNWAAIDFAVDYEMAGCKTLIEVYTEYPFVVAPDGSVTKTESLPQFAAYTDENSRYTGKLSLPAGTKTVYLYTPTLGLPRCLALDVANGKITFKPSEFFNQGSDAEKTRDGGQSPSGNASPYVVENGWLYSLSQWNGENGKYGKPSTAGYITKNDAVDAGWLTRLQHTLWGAASKSPYLDNRSQLVAEKYTNVGIAHSYVDNTTGKTVTVTKAKVTLTFLTEAGWNENTLGYYYYPTNKVPTSPEGVKKYIIFPNASVPGSVPYDGYNEGNGWFDSKFAPLANSSKITLKYVNEVTGEVSEDFPPGYTIGWFLIPDGFESKEGIVKTGAEFFYSNESWNAGNKKRCLVLNDNATRRVIVGFEDGQDDSCEDVLFFVESNPEGAILDPNKPEIGGGGVIEKSDASHEISGTLAFEDNWPAQGDYDLNDVAVAYKRVITTNSENKVKKIVDTFIPVQRADAATRQNAFAFQVDASQLGAVSALNDGIIFEKETNSFILFPNALAAAGKAFTVTRTFDGSFEEKDLKPYNPFIIINYVANSQSRSEVHLPKREPTSFADKSLIGTGLDAYYIYSDGKHPFAFDVPLFEFELVTERTMIGSKGEYPNFTKWVEEGCNPDGMHANWFKKKKE